MKTRNVAHAKEQLLEERADKLIADSSSSGVYPATTELRLSRRGRHAPLDRLPFEIEDKVNPSVRDELVFLASVSVISRIDRICFRLWVDGCTQTEMAHKLNVCQQAIQRRLRRALLACYDNLPVSFREFSRHTIYRKPSGRGMGFVQRRCRRCEEPFPLGLGFGVYCSSACLQDGK